MISLSLSPPFLWLDFFFVFLAIAPFVFCSPIAPFPALPPPPPPPPPAENSKSSTTFKPSVAIVVGILTTVFSVTFLVLLYAKHCKGGSGGESGYRSGVLPPLPDLRKNSGIDRTVIESLPVFRFGALRGHKEGLECAVCLNRFEPNEVLRLLPKCRHGFHVECVDTWLDAHSTCPLCRYRVDPEDVLLVMDPSVLQRASQEKPQMASPAPEPEPVKGKETGNFRASGRHSWAGERGPVSSLQIIVENSGGGGGAENTTPFNGRRSLDSWKKKKKNGGNGSGKNNHHETVSFGCLDRANRKDGLLLADKTDEQQQQQQQQRRLEHRIIVSDTSGPRYRWSDVEPSDSLYLQSGSLFSESRRSTAVARSGRSVINGRSVSEITGVSRFRSYEEEEEHKERRRQRQEGAVTRWLAWIAHYPSQSARTSGRSDQPPDSLTT